MVSVGFTDEGEEAFDTSKYVHEETSLGRLYYLKGMADVRDEIQVNYEVQPWMSYFTVMGFERIRGNGDKEERHDI